MPKTPTKPPVVGTRSTPPRESKRKRTNANGDLETPTTRAKRKRKAAQRKTKAAAKPVKALMTAPNPDPVEVVAAPNPDPVQVIAKAHKRCVVPPQGKKRKQSAPKKAKVVKGRWDTAEEIDDSSYSVDEESGDSDNGNKEDDNNVEPHADFSDDDNSVDRMDQFVRDVAKTVTEASKRRAEEELNRRAQEGAKDPPNENDSTTPMAKKLSSTQHVERDVYDDDELNALPREEKHVRNRIVIYVKNELFRRCKFVNSPVMFRKAFRKVLEIEKPKNHFLFQLTYEKCFNTALNQKRSTCEQAGFRIVRDAINKDFKTRGEEFFTFEEFCKLRTATSEREKRAFFFFFNNFLECVCGANAWRNAKKTMLVSEARHSDNSKIVTTSDEAFALLLIDNYLEKWKTAAAARTRLVEEDNPTPEADEVDDGQKKTTKKTTKRQPGKYTEKKQGTCKYGGWSDDGIRKFNSLRMMIKDNRACPQSKDMERELLAFCRTRAGLKNTGGDEQQEQQDCTGADKNALERAVAKMPVEAAWDSDDEDDL